MHEYLAAIQKGNEQDNKLEQQELTAGDVLKAAIHNDLRVERVTFPQDTCLDIGTPGELLKAVGNIRWLYFFLPANIE